MKHLMPLKNSHAYNKQELELKELFIVLWQKYLSSEARDANVLSNPHLGSKNLLIRYLVSQNIANFNTGSLNEDAARFLVNAWRINNPKRGVHFLKAYITAIWGNDFEIFPLYQHKSKPYPQELKTLPEIQEDKLNQNDYFQTSRLRVVLYGTEGYFSTSIAENLNKVLPARLFVEEVSRSIVGKETIIWAAHSHLTSELEAEVSDEIEIFEYNDKVQFASVSEFGSLIKHDIKVKER